MYYNIGILLIVWCLLQQPVESHNRTVYKYIRDGCIQCRQINKVVVQQQNTVLRSFTLDHFLQQLHHYHDHSTGKFVSLRSTCRKPNQILTRQRNVLPPLHPLNTAKDISPLWDIKVVNQVEDVQNSQQKETQSFFFSPRVLFRKFTTFVKDLFKRETVCLQCGKHGKFVPPYSTKTSMMKKFMQLVFGSSTDRNLRENICAVPVFRIGKTRLSQPKILPKPHLFVNKTVNISERNLFLKMDLIVPEIINTTLISVPMLKEESVQPSSNITRKVLFSLFGKGQSSHKVPKQKPESDSTTNVLLSENIPQNSHVASVNVTSVRKVHYNNWWQLISLFTEGVSPYKNQHKLIKPVKLEVQSPEEVYPLQINETMNHDTPKLVESLESDSPSIVTNKEENYLDEQNIEANQTSETDTKPIIEEELEHQEKEEIIENSPVVDDAQEAPEESQQNNNLATTHIVHNSTPIPNFPIKPKLFVLRWRNRYYGGEVAESWLAFILIFVLLLSMLHRKRLLKDLKGQQQQTPSMVNIPAPPPVIPMNKKTFELEWIVAIVDISIVNVG